MAIRTHNASSVFQGIYVFLNSIAHPHSKVVLRYNSYPTTIPFGCAGADQATRTEDELRAVSSGGPNPTGSDSLVVA